MMGCLSVMIQFSYSMKLFSLSLFLIKRQEVVLFPAFFPFDHGSIVTRVTLPWKKRQII